MLSERILVVLDQCKYTLCSSGTVKPISCQPEKQLHLYRVALEHNFRREIIESKRLGCSDLGLDYLLRLQQQTQARETETAKTHLMAGVPFHTALTSQGSSCRGGRSSGGCAKIQQFCK